MTWVQIVEIVAVLFGLACVILTVKQNIWCWPTGLVMVTLYIVVYFKARLYSDLLLQLIYVVMQIYGWWNWLHGGRDRGELPVSRISRPAALLWTGAAGAGTAGLGLAMHTYTNADVPYWDAATTVLSLVAQWLMAKKVLESWIIWIVVDVLYLGVYYYKALFPTMGMYAVFLMLAIGGFREWKKSALVPASA